MQIELSKILYIEGLKDYLKIYEEDSPKPILSLMSMKAMEELLPASRFMRVHRSYIVQKNKNTYYRPWPHRVRKELHPDQATAINWLFKNF